MPEIAAGKKLLNQLGLQVKNKYSRGCLLVVQRNYDEIMYMPHMTFTVTY